MRCTASPHTRNGARPRSVASQSTAAGGAARASYLVVRVDAHRRRRALASEGCSGPSALSEREKPMSGPKVFNVVTREELIARCEADLRRLDSTIAEWTQTCERAGAADSH